MKQTNNFKFLGIGVVGYPADDKMEKHGFP